MVIWWMPDEATAAQAQVSTGFDLGDLDER